MIYNGYVTLNISSYSAWRSATLGNYFDADQAYSYQCWDPVSEFYWNLGFGAGYPLTGPNHYVYECWTVNKDNNIGHGLSQITNLSEVKQGDVVVLSATSQVPTGHIGFADEDYNGTGSLNILGQNQDPSLQDPVMNIATFNNMPARFLGAFRYDQWQTPPTPPIPPMQNSHFKWVLLARKLRDKSLLTKEI